jgi:hypothetical protein
VPIIHQAFEESEKQYRDIKAKFMKLIVDSATNEVDEMSKSLSPSRLKSEFQLK